MQAFEFVAVTGHLERPKVRGIAERLLSLLEGYGIKAELFDISALKHKRRKFWLVCVVGGDGSLLRVARELKQSAILLGFAAGKRSYLMQVKQWHLEKAVNAIAQRHYVVEERTRLSARVHGKRLPLALNELLVVPKTSGLLINCVVRFDGKAKRISCDGLIVATPTGSSGHAYSAGGRRLSNAEKKFIVVPSNPLNRAVKPFTVSDKSRLSVRCLDDAKAEVVVDGRERFKLDGALFIERGEPALVLRLKGLR